MTDRTAREIAEGLNALAERVEMAEGPDRELDAEIARAIGLEVQTVMVMAPKPYDQLSSIHRDEGAAPVSRPLARFTASTDAASGLLLPEQRYEAGTWEAYPRGTAVVAGLTSMSPHSYGDAATPALALCAAALRARLQQESPRHD
jgi:hypothetical protein